MTGAAAFVKLNRNHVAPAPVTHATASSRALVRAAVAVRYSKITIHRECKGASTAVNESIAGSAYKYTMQWSQWYCFSWLDLRVKAEDQSHEVLQFACSFGAGEGTVRPNYARVSLHAMVQQ